MGKTYKDQPDAPKFTKNDRQRKAGKEKSIKLKNLEIEDLNFVEVTKEELESRRSNAYKYFDFEEE